MTAAEPWPALPGDYLLLWNLPAALVGLRVGRLGVFDLAPGAWIYCGSARGPGGLAARLARHGRAQKRRHWHVDFLAAALGTPAALAWPEAPGAGLHLECRLAQGLLAGPGFEAPIPGFGSSDCRAGCRAHLLRHARALDLEALRAHCVPLIG